MDIITHSIKLESSLFAKTSSDYVCEIINIILFHIFISFKEIQETFSSNISQLYFRLTYLIYHPSQLRRNFL